MAETEPTVRIVFYFAVISTLISTIPLTWAWQTPTLHTWGMLLGVGALATVAQLLLTQSYTLAPAAQVGPFTYVAVIFAGAIGWYAWGEIPDIYSFIGALLVCCAGILAMRKRGWGRPGWKFVWKE